MRCDNQPVTADSSRTVVHLVRHGEVDNPGGVLYGRLPGFHLSELGREMAVRAALYLRARDITHLVSSPLERAQETMAPLAAELKLPVTLDERVIEAGNDFEGLTVGKNPAQLVHPKFWRHLTNPVKPSWGEPYVHIAQRMRAAIADARAAATGHEAVIVSHQLPVWTARQSFAGNRLWHDPRRRKCSLGSVTSLHFVGGRVANIEYAEPAGELLSRAAKVVGA